MTAYTAMAVLVGSASSRRCRSRTQPRVAQQSIAQEQRVIDWLERKAHWPRRCSSSAPGSSAPWSAVRRFLHALRQEARDPDPRLHRELPTDRLHDGRDGEPVLPRRRLHAEGDRGRRQGLRRRDVDPRTILGGVAVARLGTNRSLVLGSVLVIGSNLLFMTLAFQQTPSLTGSRWWSARTISRWRRRTALIAYLSSLTSATYTATQYALFSSIYALPGKLLMALGFVVDAIGYPCSLSTRRRSGCRRS